MLREIRLQNYAIIDDLSISCSGGFSVITGETGAGKSILVEALALLLGGRSDADAVRHESDEAILEARFDPRPSGDSQEELILKRVLSRSKSRAYINGAFANLTTLQQVGESLAEIHGQNDHQRFTYPTYQLALLDAYAKNGERQQQYRDHYQRRAGLLKEIAALKNAMPDKGHEEEVLKYQLAEITEAHLAPDEEAQLLQEERHLKNWEAILTAVHGGYALLAEEGGVLSQIGIIEQYLRDLDHTTHDAAPELDLMQNARVHLKELALLLRNRGQGVTHDPARQDQVTQRLYLIQKMKKKYGASIEAILDRAQQIASALQHLLERQGRLKHLEERLAQETARLTQAAAALSSSRVEAIRPLEKRVKEEINRLGMEKTAFTLLHQEKSFSEDGTDDIAFLIALPGEPLKPIARVASGGELSRLMLALRVALSEADPTPTLVFDEIDTGVSGAVAEQVGQCLFRLSRNHQVFCVTHLPQVARFANHHFVVEKKIVHQRAAVSIRALKPEERIAELARLLGGVSITAAARQHAKELAGAHGERGKERHRI